MFCKYNAYCKCILCGLWHNTGENEKFYEYRPVAGGGAGGARATPEIFRLELNSATKMEFFY